LKILSHHFRLKSITQDVIFYWQLIANKILRLDIIETTIQATSSFYAKTICQVGRWKETTHTNIVSTHAKKV